MAMFASAVLFAQEKTTTVHTETVQKNSGSFWGQPWVWALGGAIFILLLVALLRGGSRTQ
jgi:hypothetical protein